MNTVIIFSGAPTDADCELAKLADYEDDDMTSLERISFSQLQTYCFNMHWVHLDEVVGHRSCDKIFTLYRSDLKAFRETVEGREPVQGVIDHCELCKRWSRQVYHYVINSTPFKRYLYVLINFYGFPRSFHSFNAKQVCGKKSKLDEKAMIRSR